VNIILALSLPNNWKNDVQNLISQLHFRYFSADGKIAKECSSLVHKATIKTQKYNFFSLLIPTTEIKISRRE
jgi:hypothetical protein